MPPSTQYAEAIADYETGVILVNARRYFSTNGNIHRVDTILLENEHLTFRNTMADINDIDDTWVTGAHEVAAREAARELINKHWRSEYGRE